MYIKNTIFWFQTKKVFWDLKGINDTEISVKVTTNTEVAENENNKTKQQMFLLLHQVD